MILPGQQMLLHVLWSTLEPEHVFPPQEGVGLLHALVNVRFPPLPHDLEHGPDVHELHPPSTTQ